MADVTPIDVLPPWPRRKPDGHKGTYGTALIVAGSRDMAGAAVLCGRAALRGGAGLVRVACPAGVQPVVAAGSPCYLTAGLPDDADAAAKQVFELANTADAVAVGPGLGQEPDAFALARRVVRELPGKPTVVDADGLNALAPFTPAFRGRSVPLVLTPHPGEFARLAGTSVADTQADREKAAVAFAGRFGVVLLLKGTGTLVTDGRRLYRNTTGNPGMATGGTGDVLTGLIAALLTQGLSPLDAAVLGAWAHGRAGDLAAATLGETALTAADLPDYLSEVFRDLEARS